MTRARPCSRLKIDEQVGRCLAQHMAVLGVYRSAVGRYVIIVDPAVLPEDFVALKQEIRHLRAETRAMMSIHDRLGAEDSPALVLFDRED